MSTKPLSIYVKTLGCKVNQVESERLMSEMADLDVALADAVDNADVVVVNTCTVTSEADAKTRKAIRKVARLPHVQLVVVTGCSAALHEEELNALDPCVRVIADKTRIAAELAHHFNLTSRDASLTRGELRKEHPGLFRSRSFIKVQDGCDYFCSYCIVPYARGHVRSTPAKDVVAEVEQLARDGVREIVLTGINIGRYQDPQREEVDLCALIEELEKTSIDRIRVSSIEPNDVDERFLSLLAKGSKLCEHLHIPLQSGSDRVLKAMNRRYSAAQFLDTIRSVYAASQHCSVTTDVIVGFPGETDEDFEETLSVCQECGFSKIHVFKYSKREGTPAAKMEQVPDEVIAQRAARLRALSDELAKRYRKRAQGRTLEVLVETSRDGALIATSREHIVIQTPVGALSLDGELMQPGGLYRVLG